ncbi:4fe-4s-binding protein [Lasius niger]|uniref:4fe-4s-binding protein n=1 Tax=Lasius niger TaxID=67767 RepID=A0A0J7KE37_LASNI|nr:4fe-4s-binding protein [Lasius niger]
MSGLEQRKRADERSWKLNRRPPFSLEVKRIGDHCERAEVQTMEEAVLTEETVPTRDEPKEDPGKPGTGKAAIQPENRPKEVAEERTSESGGEAVLASSQKIVE